MSRTLRLLFFLPTTIMFYSFVNEPCKSPRSEHTLRNSAEDLIQAARTGFRRIGYRDELVYSDYKFADFLSPENPVRTVSLAGFAQQPPSYRTAAFAVVVNGTSEGAIADYTALGAPHLFVIDQHRSEIQRWRLLASKEPLFVEALVPDQFASAIERGREEFAPENLLRAKALTQYQASDQVDFFDLGFFPILEQELQRKLDNLFGRTVSAAVSAYRSRYSSDLAESDYRGLFRLIFRLVAAKLLADRNYPGEWAPSNVREAIANVEQFYFRSSKPERLYLHTDVQQVVWDEIRNGLHLQNLSLEALAYVYENTFVSTETRRAYDTHATPPEIAEYIVRQLPFEALPQNGRSVFEPFAGHAPFLTAALGRLRTLLPPSTTVEARHEYLVRMLSGIEVDSFAREVARYSLILADYPNPNGWRITEANAYDSPDFHRYLKASNIVLCNPPYGDFTREERSRYSDLRSPNRAVEAFLRVLDRSPEMLGFVLPRSFADGNLYRVARQRLLNLYGKISITALPDIAFRFSQVDTVLVLASDRAQPRKHIHRVFVSREDYAAFWSSGRATWEDIEDSSALNHNTLWQEPLVKNLRAYLSDHKKLGAAGEIHRGFQYNTPVEEHVRNNPADEWYAPGLHTVENSFGPYAILDWKYLDTRPEAMSNRAYQYQWGKRKIILNAARLSRGPWRITAAIDDSGLVCYQRFHSIWPISDVSAEVIAATLNGPLANALLTTGKGRDNKIQDVRAIPLPDLSPEDSAVVVELVSKFRREASAGTPQTALVELATQIDLIVLFGYNLPAWLLRELLAYFEAFKHPRFGMSFTERLAKRYGSLVDQKFLIGLTESETSELHRINFLLDEAEANFYEPIKQMLSTVKASAEMPRQ